MFGPKSHLRLSWLLLLLLLLLCGAGGCDGDPEDRSPQEDAAVQDGSALEDSTADGEVTVDAGDCVDPERPPNVYVVEVVSYDPLPAGSARTASTDPGIIDDAHWPVLNDRAFGPPHGTGCGEGAYDVLAVGINGSATFRFDPGWAIVDGPGDDFITFEGRFAWSCYADQMVNELAHVMVSEDGTHWYYNSAEAYDVNPDPQANNDGYVWANVTGLHGNNPTWANPDEDMQAQHMVDGRWVDLPGQQVCRDIDPQDPNLGGDRFDLATFRSTNDDSPWPSDGRMRYLRIIDDDHILDGQDYAKPWSTGAHLQAALGVNVVAE